MFAVECAMRVRWISLLWLLSAGPALADLDGMLRARLARTASTAGLPAGSLAEAFTIVRTE